jgi:hypothetical protein
MLLRPTARAYWADRQYWPLLRRRKYSENTIRRRMVVWGKWQKAVQEAGRFEIGR